MINVHFASDIRESPGGVAAPEYFKKTWLSVPVSTGL